MDRDSDPVAQDLLEAFMRFKRPHLPHGPAPGLTHSEMMVLTCIKKGSEKAEDGIRVSDISNMLRVASPTITQQINSLEAEGFVERSMDKDDRRAVRVRLTPKGETIIQAVWDSFIQLFNGLTGYLGAEDSRELARLMTKVHQYFAEKAASDGRLRQNGVV